MFPFLSAGEDGRIDREVWGFKFYVYVHVFVRARVCACVIIQQQ